MLGTSQVWEAQPRCLVKTRSESMEKIKPLILLKRRAGDQEIRRFLFTNLLANVKEDKQRERRKSWCVRTKIGFGVHCNEVTVLLKFAGFGTG